MHLIPKNIEDRGTALLVNIPNKKTKVSRSFTVAESYYLHFYRKYIAIQQEDIKYRLVCFKCKEHKCTRNTVGIHI